MNESQKTYILYLDDFKDHDLDDYLNTFCKERKAYGAVYSFFQFEEKKGFENTIKEDKIRKADILLIDYKLYIDRDRIDHKFRGSELRVAIQALYPHKKIIIITQENTDMNGVIHKYNKNKMSINNAEEYYDKKLSSLLDWYCKETLDTKSVLLEYEDGKIDVFNKTINDMISLSADSDNPSRIPSEKEIDELIDLFKEMINEKSI